MDRVALLTRECTRGRGEATWQMRVDFLLKHQWLQLVDIFHGKSFFPLQSARFVKIDLFAEKR